MEVSHVLINGSLSPLSQYRKPPKNLKTQVNNMRGTIIRDNKRGVREVRGRAPTVYLPQ